MKSAAFLLLTIVIVGVNSQFGFPTNPLGSLTQAGQTVPGLDQISQGLKSVLEGQWNNFQSLKQYASDAERQAAKNIFLVNGAAIDAFNKASNTFTQSLNQFADLANSEFNKLCNGFKVNLAKLAGFSKGTTFNKDTATSIPEEVDWRKKGAVSPVKSQGLCASCYAFSSAGAIEGQNFRKTGQLEELSPQSFMDCSKKYGNDGCDGGFTESSFEYAKSNKGISKLSSYPYEAKGGQCRYNPNSASAIECKGYGIVPKNEKALEAAVAAIGPISVAIDASGEGFQFYKDGVYYNPKCGNKEGDLNHAVLLVGYGKEPNGQKYWLVKNSYGKDWGIDGYFKIAKDANNHCGIATYARYPIL